jgi:hypothetical protein
MFHAHSDFYACLRLAQGAKTMIGSASATMARTMAAGRREAGEMVMVASVMGFHIRG